MTKEQHTPTPWEVGDEADIPYQCQSLLEGRGTEREWTAIHDVHEDGPEVVALCHPSNAVFIVRAVNNHQALIEALVVAQIYLGDDATDDSPEARVTREVVRKALERVKC